MSPYRLRAPRRAYSAPAIIDQAIGNILKLNSELHPMLARLQDRISELTFLRFWNLSDAHEREYVVEKILKPAGWR